MLAIHANNGSSHSVIMNVSFKVKSRHKSSFDLKAHCKSMLNVRENEHQKLLSEEKY